MAKRLLSADERTKVHDWALARERQSHPDARIDIVVHDETDENGEPRYAAIISRERVVPRSQLPF